MLEIPLWSLQFLRIRRFCIRRVLNYLNLRKGIKIVDNNNEGFLWWKLSKDFFNTKNDIYICSTYIPPCYLYSVLLNFFLGAEPYKKWNFRSSFRRQPPSPCTYDWHHSEIFNLGSAVEHVDSVESQSGPTSVNIVIYIYGPC